MTDPTTLQLQDHVGSHVRDTRRVQRILLAVIAPLPMAAQGVYYLLLPPGAFGDASFLEQVAAMQEHPDLSVALRFPSAVFCWLLVPAVVAVWAVVRRRTPRLGLVGALWAGLGTLAGFTLMGGVDTPQVLAVMAGLDPTHVLPFYEAAQDDPLMVTAALLFISGIVVGLGLLGAALWRSGTVPAIFGVAIMFGGITHPFLPTSAAAGIGLLVAAFGFAGASVALLRMTDDEFDLAPMGEGR
ncbi:MAG: hypothetical protein ACRDO4_12995 [Nocardioides sp.]